MQTHVAVTCITVTLQFSFASPEPMHDNGTQTIKAEVVEPIVEVQETCREEANTSSSYSPSPRTVYTCNDGKVREILHASTLPWFPLIGIHLLPALHCVFVCFHIWSLLHFHVDLWGRIIHWNVNRVIPAAIKLLTEYWRMPPVDNWLTSQKSENTPIRSFLFVDI